MKPYLLALLALVGLLALGLANADTVMSTNKGDTAWVLVASVLVTLMVIPESVNGMRCKVSATQEARYINEIGEPPK